MSFHQPKTGFLNVEFQWGHHILHDQKDISNYCPCVLIVPVKHFSTLHRLTVMITETPIKAWGELKINK